MQSLAAYRRVARTPGLRGFLPAVAGSALGDGMSLVVIPWLVITIAPADQLGWWIAIALAAYTLPATLGRAVFGRLLRGLTGARLVAADATLRMAALGVIAALGVAGVLTPAVYVILLAVSSLLHAWSSAGMYTMVAERLPEDDHVAGNALLSTIMQSAFIVGPALAGILVPIIGPAWAIGVDALSFAALAIVAAAIARQPIATPSATPSQAAAPAAAPAESLSTARSTAPSVAADGGAAKRWSVAGELRLLIVVTCVFFFLYGPIEVALPILVVQHESGSAALLGAFWTVFGIGAVLGGLSAAAMRHLPLWTVVAAIIVGWGLALLPLGLSGNLAFGFVGFGFGGFIYGPFTSITTALFQRAASPEALSAVLATRSALTLPATATGTLAGGPLVNAIGATATILASGLLTIALGIGVALAQMRSLQKGTSRMGPGSASTHAPNSRTR